MKHFNIVKNHNTFVHDTRLPLGAVYGQFRFSNGATMTYYVDDFDQIMGALFFHVWDDKAHKWHETNTRAKSYYRAFYAYLCSKFDKFSIWGTKCEIYVDNSLLPVRKRAQTNDDMFYKIPNVGYALNTRIMTDDTVSYCPRACVVASDHNYTNRSYSANHKAYA